MDRSIFGDSRCGQAVALTLLLASAPAAAETPRAECRAAMQTAPRADAIAACDRAVADGVSAEDLWAAAEVRVARPEVPTPDDLIRADLLARAAARLAPGEPWAALADLAIARRWGDPVLIERSLDELRRVAPGDPRTAEALARARPALRPSLIVGWCILLLACALTAGHAIRRGRRRPAAAAVAVAASLLIASPAGAAELAFPIDDADPEGAVPTPAEADARPLDFAYYLQDLTGRARAAADRGDLAAAVRYHRALARAVPDASLPRQQLCASLQALGDGDGALAACRDALGLDGARAEDFVRFGDLVLAKAVASAAELDEVEAAARHLSAQPAPSTRVLGLQLACRLAVRSHRVRLLDECSGGLAAAAPDEPSTTVFRWSLALERGDVALARQLVARARAGGVAADGLAQMTAATESAAGARTLARTLVRGGGAVAVAGAFLALGLAGRRRRRRVSGRP